MKNILLREAGQGSAEDRFLNGYFFNPTKGDLTIEGVVEEIINYISEKPDNFYDIIVGCDSSSSEEPMFPLAVVVLRTGEGGRFFLQRVFYKDRKFYNWKQRILEEVFLSCQLALHLRESFSEKMKLRDNVLNYQFRYIHADVGEKGQTKDMVKEVTGLILGNGFEPKIKPESFAASNVADRFS